MRVDLVILTFNRAHLLKDALGAALAQTYRNLTVVVSDNASTDETFEVVAGHGDPRLSYLRHSTNIGNFQNHVRAIQRCCGDLLIVTHDDDILDPDYVRQCVAAFAADTELVAVATNVRLIDGLGNVRQHSLYPVGPDRTFQAGEYALEYVRTGLWMPPSTICMRWNRAVRRVMLPRPDGTSEYVGANDDVYLVALLNSLGSVRLLGSVNAAYREHGNQLSMRDDFVSGTVQLYAAIRRLYRRKGPSEPRQQLVSAERFARLQSHLLGPNLLTRAAIRRLMAKLPRGVETAKGAHLDVLAALVDAKFAFSAPTAKPTDLTIRALEAWGSRLRSHTGNAFDPLVSAGMKRIAVFGSMLIARMLQLDAESAGVRVVAFVDGNRARQGRTMAGIPIVSHDWLADDSIGIDAVVLSSEKNKSDALRALISSRLAQRVPVVCWKDLLVDLDAVSGLEVTTPPEGDHCRP